MNLPPPPRDLPPKPTSPMVNVIIAEDNPILLQGLERALSANGYAVSTASNGHEALELLRGNGLPDIMLLDVMMPEMNGIEVLTAVRRDPRTANMPIMLITAAADELGPGGALGDYQADVLIKPFRLNELLQRIEQLVGPLRSSWGGAAEERLPRMPMQN